MAEIIDLVITDAEVEAFERRLEDYLEAQQLKRAMGGDDFFA